MPIIISVKADVDELRGWLSTFPANKVNVAAMRAINKTLANVRTESSKQIREERALKASVVRDALKINKATKSTLQGSLIASGRPIPLREYDARLTKGGVTVRVSPGGRKLVALNGNKAFLIERFGNNVYVRTGDKRLPIKKLYGPSIPATFLKDKVVNAMRDAAGDAWPKRFAEEMRYEMARA